MKMNETFNYLTNSSGKEELTFSFDQLAVKDFLGIVITSFGTITNLFNSLVFVKTTRFKDMRYKYLLVKSITKLVYMAFSLTSALLTNCTLCPSSHSYFSIVYSIAVSYYFISCLAIFRMLIEIVLSIHTYFVLIKRVVFRVSFKAMLAVLFTISVLFYAQKPFGYTIVQVNNGNTTFYNLAYTSFYFSTINTVFNISQATVRIFLVGFVLTFMNVLDFKEFKRWIKNRSNCRNKFTKGGKYIGPIC